MKIENPVYLLRAGRPWTALTNLATALPAANGPCAPVHLEPYPPKPCKIRLAIQSVYAVSLLRRGAAVGAAGEMPCLYQSLYLMEQESRLTQAGSVGSWGLYQSVYLIVP